MTERIIWVTGTDTHVGKTVVSGLLLTWLRLNGINAYAMKPFCSGGRQDVETLSKLQDHELTLDDINPYFFKEPVAPLVAGKNRRHPIQIQDVVLRIKGIQRKYQWLIIEGAGGLMTPLGKGFSLLDLIKILRGQIIIVAPNRLGVLNHALLTLRVLPPALRKMSKISLINQLHPDSSSQTNLSVLSEIIGPKNIVELPFLSNFTGKMYDFKKSAKKLKKTLAVLIDLDTLSAP